MGYESIELDTRLSVETAARVFHAAISSSNSQATFGKIKAATDRTPEFAAFASGKTFTSQWCVQIYIHDDGESRHVKLAILGSSMLAKAWEGTRNSHSVSAGRLRAVSVIDALKEAERALG